MKISKMMESTRMRPEFLVSSLEYDTEFYSTPPEGKWHQHPDVRQITENVSVDIDTSEEFFIDDLLNFDATQEPINHKMPSPVHRLVLKLSDCD